MLMLTRKAALAIVFILFYCLSSVNLSAQYWNSFTARGNVKSVTTYLDSNNNDQVVYREVTIYTKIPTNTLTYTYLKFNCLMSNTACDHNLVSDNCDIYTSSTSIIEEPPYYRVLSSTCDDAAILTSTCFYAKGFIYIDASNGDTLMTATNTSSYPPNYCF